MEKALFSSQVAVPLVSTDYLASDWIVEEELPLILERADAGELVVLPIILSPSAFERSDLRKFRAVNSPSSPLISKTRAEQDKIFRDVVRTIRRYFTHAAAVRRATPDRIRPGLAHRRGRRRGARSSSATAA